MAEWYTNTNKKKTDSKKLKREKRTKMFIWTYAIATYNIIQ